MSSQRQGWTRDELLVVLNVYHKLTFGQLHARNPAIRDLAPKLGRTSNSVAMKLCNMASLDPALQLRGIRGLPGASRLDRMVWAEFQENLEESIPASEELLRRKLGISDDKTEVEISPRRGIILSAPAPDTETETEAVGRVQQRRGQDFFRNAVLNNWGEVCALTGLPIRQLLVASHILPWAQFPLQRLNVRNGLSLSRLHDAAFDQGLITFDDDLRLQLSPLLTDHLDRQILTANFGNYAGQQLALPEDALAPRQEFLHHHRTNIYRAA